MKLTLKRAEPSANSMLGELFVDGVFECYTLEDIKRKEKVFGDTAIPSGTYVVIINLSNRFKKLMPLLLSVPNFEGIRIHKGNTAIDTHGCILVGAKKGIDSIGNSALAYARLFKKMQFALASKETISITIS